MGEGVRRAIEYRKLGGKVVSTAAVALSKAPCSLKHLACAYVFALKGEVKLNVNSALGIKAYVMLGGYSRIHVFKA